MNIPYTVTLIDRVYQFKFEVNGKETFKTILDGLTLMMYLIIGCIDIPNLQRALSFLGGQVFWNKTLYFLKVLKITRRAQFNKNEGKDNYELDYD